MTAGFRKLLPENDPPTTKDERHAALQERLERKLMSIRNGQTQLQSVNFLDSDEMVADVFGDLITLLRLRCLTPSAHDLLAAHLSSFNTIEQFREVLQLPRPSHRPSKTEDENESIWAYEQELAVNEGNEQLALIAAYNAYNSTWNFEKDSRTPRARGRASTYSNVADIRTAEIIRPMLIDAGCSVTRPKRGRPKKSR